MIERLCDARGATASGSADPLDALARAAEVLELPAPEEHRGVLREEAAALVDGLLVRVARGRGALEVAIGEGLSVIAEGDHALRLGFSGVGDYARERLGIAARTAQELARLARELRSRPLLGAAVRAGVVSARKAAVLLPVPAARTRRAGWSARGSRRCGRSRRRSGWSATTRRGSGSWCRSRRSSGRRLTRRWRSRGGSSGRPRRGGSASR